MFNNVSKDNAINKNLNSLQNTFSWSSHDTIDIWLSKIGNIVVSKDTSSIEDNMFHKKHINYEFISIFVYMDDRTKFLKIVNYHDTYRLHL